MNKTATEIPKALFDATVKSQISTGRYASKVVRDIIGLLNAADKEILVKIAATEAPFSEARLQALLKEIRTTLKEIYGEAGAELKQQMLDFAEVQASTTAAAIDSADTHAGLMAVAHGFSDSLAQLLGYFAEIMGIEAPDMEAHANDDFGAAKGSQAGLQELTKARALGDISREAWVSEMVRRGELAEDFDADEDGERLDSEGPPLATVTTKKTTQTDKTDIGDAA